MRWLANNWIEVLGWIVQVSIVSALIAVAWAIGYEGGVDHAMKVLHWCGTCP
jgi:uncharacterized membrane protein